MNKIKKIEEIWNYCKLTRGEDTTIVLNTIELLEWIDIPRMKEQSCKYINQINE